MGLPSLRDPVVRPPQAATRSDVAINLFGLRLAPRILERVFLMRILFLRLSLILLYTAGLDSLWTRAAVQAAAGHRPTAKSSWQARLGLLGVLLPLVFNWVGLLWPLLRLKTFECQYASFHKALVYCCIAGKVLEELSQLSVSYGTCRQTMLLLGLLFIVHQDADYIRPLSAMLAAFSMCHAATVLERAQQQLPSTKSNHTATPMSATSTTTTTTTSSSSGLEQVMPGLSPVEVIVAGEYLVVSYMVIVVLHRLYLHYAPPREQLPRGATPALARAWRRASVSASCSMPGCLTTRSTDSTGDGTATPTRAAFSSNGSAASAASSLQTLPTLFATKLAAVKCCNAVYLLAAAAWQYQLLKVVSAEGGPTSNNSNSGALDTGTPLAMLCGAYGALLLLHAAVILLRPAWLHGFDQAVNSVSMIVCFSIKAGLVTRHVYGLSAGTPHLAAAQGIGAPLAFHNFIIMVPSLMVHECSMPWFRLLLAGLALFWCQGSTLLRLSMSDQGVFTSAGMAILGSGGMELLGYVPWVCLVLASYSWACVGRYAAPLLPPITEGCESASPWVRRSLAEYPYLGENPGRGSSCGPSAQSSSGGGVTEDAAIHKKQCMPVLVPARPDASEWEAWRGTPAQYPLPPPAYVEVTPPAEALLGPPPMTRRFRGSTGGIAGLLDKPRPTSSTKPPNTSSKSPRTSFSSGGSKQVPTPPPHVPGSRVRRNSTLKSTSYPACSGQDLDGMPASARCEPPSVAAGARARSASETVGQRRSLPSRPPALNSSIGGALSEGRPWRRSVTDGTMAAANAFTTAVIAKVSTWQAAQWSSRGVSLAGGEGSSSAEPGELQAEELLLQHQHQQEQRASDPAVALCCIIMWAPAVLGGMKGVLWPSAELGLLTRALGLVGVTLHAGLATWHLVVRLWWPQLLQKVPRDHMWSLLITVLTVVTFTTDTLLALPSRVSVRMALCVHTALLGLLDVSLSCFSSWLPALVLTCILKQAWDSRTHLSSGLLASVALDCNVSPLISFTLMTLATRCLRAAATAAVRTLCSREAAPLWHSRLLVAAPVVAQALLASLLWCVGLLGSPDAPAVLEPFSVLPLLNRGLMRLLERWHLYQATRADALETLVVILVMCIFFMVLSMVQAYVFNSSDTAHARHAWYEEHMAQVVALPQQAVSRLAAHKDSDSPSELRALVMGMASELAASCFPGYSLLLMLLEDASLNSEMVNCHVVQAAPDASDLHLHHQQQQMPLELLPTVELACRRGQMLVRSTRGAGLSGCDDLQVLAETYGCDSFLVVPLACAGQDQGALLVACRSPVSPDMYVTRLAKDMGAALAHTLYTVACVNELQANKHIIQDILPEKVARHMTRSMTQRMAYSNSATPSSGGGGASCPVSPKSQPTARSSVTDATTPSSSTAVEGPTSSSAVEDLSSSGHSEAELPLLYKQWHPAVSVLFADIANYTSMSQEVEPEQVMMLLHELFSKFDHLCSQYGIYKVETIGDCYMACAGLLIDDSDHAAHLVQFGQLMLGAAATVPHPQGGSVHIRVGIHSGRVMSGIVGAIRSRYCLFGDTVNTASRMESTGKVDSIQVSEDTYQLLGELQAAFEPREAMAVKGKGVMNNYILRQEVAQQLLRAGGGGGGGGTQHAGYW